MLWRQLRRTNSFAGQVGLTMMANLLLACIGMITGLILARILNPEQRGELAAVQSWPVLLATIAMIGMPEAVVYVTSRTPTRIGTYLLTALIINMIAGGALGIAGWVFMPVLLAAQAVHVIEAARICLIGMVVAYALSLAHHGLRAVGAWKAWNILRLLPNLIWLSGLLIFPLMLGQPTIDRLNLLFISAHLAFSLIALFVLVRSGIEPYRFVPGTMKPLLAFGIPSALQVLPQTLNLRLDQLLMAGFLEPRVLGLYSIGVLWSNAASPILNAVAPVLFPRLSALHRALEQYKLIQSVMAVSVAANVLLTVVMLAITPFALPALFGQAYGEAIPATLILIVAAAVSNTNVNLIAAIRGLGRPRASLNAELLGLVVTAVALMLLLRPAGLIGAAIASLLAYSATCAYLLLALRRATRTQRDPAA